MKIFLAALLIAVAASLPAAGPAGASGPSKKSEVNAIHHDFAAMTKEVHAIEALQTTGESRATEAGNAIPACYVGRSEEAGRACEVAATELWETDERIMKTVVREVSAAVVAYDYAKGYDLAAKSKMRTSKLKLWVKKLGEYLNGDTIRYHTVQAAVAGVRS